MSDTGDVGHTGATTSGRPPRARLLSGSGRYADPWHPFADTSPRLAAVLRSQGFDVETRSDVDAGLADLTDDVDLLVANVSDPSLNGPEPAAASAARTGLLAYLARGGPVLSLHLSTFPGIPEWESLLGARWIEGTSMHPPIGPAHVRVHPERHPIVATSTDFDLHDERYCFLRLAPDIVPLASHTQDGVDHPLLWARERNGVRAVYDALGHDARSYDSPEHRALLERAVRWLVGGLLSREAALTAASERLRGRTAVAEEDRSAVLDSVDRVHDERAARLSRWLDS